MRCGFLCLIFYISVPLFSQGGVPVFAAAFRRTPQGAAEKTHPFSIHDMLVMDRISDPQVSPDGNWIVFVLRKTDLDANKGRTDLWLTDIEGQKIRRLTTHPESDTNPRWAPDSRTIYFVSSRETHVKHGAEYLAPGFTGGFSKQIWQIRIDGGEAQQITDEPLDVANLVVSPDGKNIAFTMEVFPKSTPRATKEKLDEIEKRKSTGKIYDKLFVRHWDNFKHGRRSHLFVIPMDIGTTGGNAIDVMAEMDADCPSKPFGGPEEITFTPDNRNVIFTARNLGEKEAWSTDFDLYLAPINGSEKPRCLTEENEAWDTQPVFSPDGKMLAYLAMERPGYESDRLKIVLKNWPKGREKTLTQNWDRSVSEFVWSGDGKTIYTTAANLGQKSLFAIDAGTGNVTTLVKYGTIRSPAAAGGRIIFSLDNLSSPAELYSVNSNGSDIQKITNINAEKIADARMGDYEQFTFAGWNDETVWAYVVKPADFKADSKYPIAFLIHGGPQGSFSNNFHYRWNPQAFAGAGYAVVMVDFHGSTGYGQKFCDSIRGNWGSIPLKDLQMGLAAAIEKYPWMDGDRVGALGASFGGYMINWIAGNWPDRFRCLVNHDGNLDERMAYFDTEELWFPEWDHLGTPWQNPAGYEKHNPVNYVQNWKTPMLVIHGQLDYRVPVTQGLGTFNALQRLGIPGKLLYFPDENHWVLKPANSILWHDTVIGWLDQWLKQ